MKERKIYLLTLLALAFTLCVFVSPATAKAEDNETMMQYFEWNATNDGSFWNTTGKNAAELSKVGITSLWLPPAYKGNSGTYDVGYGAYDLYDLGEFNQKGTVRTKYGTKDEYLAAINSLHKNNIKVYADVVLNHKAGADATEVVTADVVRGDNRNTVLQSGKNIISWTKFNFTGRNGKYSTFKWDASCFDGVDYDNRTKTNAIFRLSGHSWDSGCSTENGNYDYLMYADVDTGSTKVANELKSWGKWYTEFANLDGFRLDAVKHIDSGFYKQWLASVRNTTGRSLFTVGEYYSGNVGELTNYLEKTGYSMSLFDFALHYRFEEASKSNGNYNMANLFKNTLVSAKPDYAVTFVDNHDTQPGQSTSTVGNNFKVQAYTAILTRAQGVPCVFYGDYYGTADSKIPSFKLIIDKLLLARKNYAYGTGHDYLSGSDIIGWTLEGDTSHANSGLAAIITDKSAGDLKMFVGTKHANETWYDITGNYSGTVKIDANGYGTFHVKENSASVWVKRITTPATNNSVTIYYRYPATYTCAANIHYQVGSKAWTTAPGVKMTADKIAGYDGITISMGSDTAIQCCFNDGSKWDNNSNANYYLTPGTYYIVNGKVTKGTPTALKLVGDISKVTATTRTNTSVTLSWTKASSATSYVVYVLDNTTGKVLSSYSTKETTYKVSGIKTASKYTFVVKSKRAYRGNTFTGTSPKYVTYTAPNMPKNLKQTSQTSTSVTLTWDKAAGANGYKIYRYDATKKGYVPFAEVSATTNIYTVTGLTNATAYKYAVKSFYKAGTVYYFNEAQALITAATQPFKTVFKLTSTTKGQVNVSWTALARTDGYAVYYATSANGPFTWIGNTTATNYVKTGLTSGKTYYFVVKSYKKGSNVTAYGLFDTKSIKVK